MICFTCRAAAQTFPARGPPTSRGKEEVATAKIEVQSEVLTTANGGPVFDSAMLDAMVQWLQSDAAAAKNAVAKVPGYEGVVKGAGSVGYKVALAIAQRADWPMTKTKAGRDATPHVRSYVVPVDKDGAMVADPVLPDGKKNPKVKGEGFRIGRKNADLWTPEGPVAATDSDDDATADEDGS